MVMCTLFDDIRICYMNVCMICDGVVVMIVCSCYMIACMLYDDMVYDGVCVL